MLVAWLSSLCTCLEQELMSDLKLGSEIESGLELVEATAEWS